MFLDKNNPIMNELVSWFQTNFPVLWREMSQSNHSAAEGEPNPYHLEDSILAHTMMVCLQAENNDANKVVMLSALLHDIGKPEARDIIPFEQKKPVYSESNEIRNDAREAGNDSGLQRVMSKSGNRTHFRGHEGLSVYRAIEILNKLEQEDIINVEEKIQILTIVGLHGTLFDSIKDGAEYKPQNVIAKFQDIQLYRDFVSQVRNDSTGRFFSSKDGRKNDAQGLGVTLYNDETFNAYYIEPRVFDDSAPTITLLVGVPASGKSTWREANVHTETVVLCRDDIMMTLASEIAYNGNYSEVWKLFEEKDMHKEVDAREQEMFKQAVKDRKNIVVDRTNMSRKSRRKWLTNVSKDYKKEAIIFATVYEDIYSRNKKRAQETGKNITNHLIGQMMRQFIVPTHDEVDSIKWVF